MTTPGGMTVNSLGEPVVYDDRPSGLEQVASLDEMTTEQLEVYLKWRQVADERPLCSTVRHYARLQGGKKALDLSAEFRAVKGAEADRFRPVFTAFAEQWGAEIGEWEEKPFADEPTEVRFEFDVNLWKYPPDVIAELTHVLRVTLLNHDEMVTCINPVI